MSIQLKPVVPPANVQSVQVQTPEHVDSTASVQAKIAPDKGAVLDSALQQLPAPQASTTPKIGDQRALGILAKGPMDLVHPESYPECVSLHAVVKDMAPAARTVLLQAVVAKLGDLVPKDVVKGLSKAAGDPNQTARLIATLLTHTPQEMRIGLDLAHQAGKLSGQVALNPLLDGTTSMAWGDLSTLAAQVTVPTQKPTSLADLLAKAKLPAPPGAENIVFGSVPNTQVSVEVKKRNILFADVLNRVGQGKLTVTLPDGSAATTVDQLLKGLNATGLAYVRAADFIDMKLLKGGQVFDVPMATLVKLESDDGKRASANVAPHSELHIMVGDLTVRGFQGIDGTGFFPAGLSRPSTWVGGNVLASFKTEQVAEASQIMAVYARLGTAYGDGVCNDSVMMALQLLDKEAMKQNRLSDSVTLYPMLLPDSRVDAAIVRLLNDSSAQPPLTAKDRATLNEMQQALKLLPADDGTGGPVSSASAAERAGRSPLWGNATTTTPAPLAAAEDALQLNKLTAAG